ncbi:MAG: DUF3240 family protein [Gammaproteobacteria bacterium]|nr:DUF3240 family protein [Gammaproteobacteria bacterium]
MSNSLLSIIAPPELEDMIVDWLLEQPYVQGFSSYPINGHGVRPDKLSLAEQVTSRQRKVKFEVNGTDEEIRGAISSLQKDFGHCDIYFWQIAVGDSGYVCVK